MPLKIVFERSGVFLFESFDIKDMLCYCREDDGSSLTGRFMTITEQRHESAKTLKKCFLCFCEKTFCEFLRFLREIINFCVSAIFLAEGIGDKKK